MSARPLGSHPEPEQLDDLLDGSGPSSVRAHVAECAFCDNLLEELRRVRELLGAARDVGDTGMPEDLSSRISQRLALEARQPDASPGLAFDDSTPSFGAWPPPSWTVAAAVPAAGPAETADVSADKTAPVVPLRPRRRRLTTWLAAAAAVCAVGVGGGLLFNRDDGQMTATSLPKDSSEAGGVAADTYGAPEEPEAVGPREATPAQEPPAHLESSGSVASGAPSEEEATRVVEQLEDETGKDNVGALDPTATDPTTCLQGLRSHDPGLQLPSPAALSVYETTWDGGRAVILIDRTSAYVVNPECLNGGPAELLHRYGTSR